MHLGKSKCESARLFHSSFSYKYYIPSGFLMKVMLSKNHCWTQLVLVGKFGGFEYFFLRFFYLMLFWCRSMQNSLELRLLNSLVHDFPISGPQEYLKKNICLFVCWKLEDTGQWAMCLPFNILQQGVLQVRYSACKVQSTILFCLHKHTLGAKYQVTLLGKKSILTFIYLFHCT